MSTLVRFNAGTGIQRVALNVLLELICNPPKGYRIEPVYTTPELHGKYRYARAFSFNLLNIDHLLPDDFIAPIPGDFFLAIDLDLDNLRAPAMQWLGQFDIEIYIMVHDLICLRYPEYFVDEMEPQFRSWFDTIAKYATGVVCNSRSTADDVADQMAKYYPQYQDRLKISWFHLGADVESSLPAASVDTVFEQRFNQLCKTPYILMVSTVEPRKGYADALDAFEQLWYQGEETRLVIVGRPGWKVKALIERLRNHPLAEKRLFWFDNATDHMLIRLYEQASGVLVASEAEGFGLSLIEAARYHLPLLVRDIPIFRELGGNAVSYFDRSIERSLAIALKQFIQSIRDGKPLSSAEIQWLTWAESTKQLMDVLGNPQHSHWLQHTRS